MLSKQEVLKRQEEALERDKKIEKEKDRLLKEREKALLPTLKEDYKEKIGKELEMKVRNPDEYIDFIHFDLLYNFAKEQEDVVYELKEDYKEKIQEELERTIRDPDNYIDFIHFDLLYNFIKEQESVVYELKEELEDLGYEVEVELHDDHIDRIGNASTIELIIRWKRDPNVN